MKYFEIFGLEPMFDIDSAELKRTFFLKSREYHPDFHTQASDEKKEEMLVHSSLLNQAYETLKKTRSRKKYILTEHGLLGDEKGSMPQSFLMEMMEFNEKLMELEMNDDATIVDSLKKDADQKLSEFENESKLYEDQYDSDIDRESALSNIKEIYLKQQYLHRVLGNLGRM